MFSWFSRVHHYDLPHEKLLLSFLWLFHLQYLYCKWQWLVYCQYVLLRYIIRFRLVLADWDWSWSFFNCTFSVWLEIEFIHCFFRFYGFKLYLPDVNLPFLWSLEDYLKSNLQEFFEDWGSEEATVSTFWSFSAIKKAFHSSLLLSLMLTFRMVSARFIVLKVYSLEFSREKTSFSVLAAFLFLLWHHMFRVE